MFHLKTSINNECLIRSQIHSRIKIRYEPQSGSLRGSVNVGPIVVRTKRISDGPQLPNGERATIRHTGWETIVGCYTFSVSPARSIVRLVALFSVPW